MVDLPFKTGDYRRHEYAPANERIVVGNVAHCAILASVDRVGTQEEQHPLR
jgi:hypothetical protein